MRLLPPKYAPQTPEPLTLLEAAQHLKLADTEEDAQALEDKALVEGLIAAAREAVENYTNRAVKEATYELVSDVLPCKVKLPKPPFVEVESVECFNGSEQVTLPAEDYTIIEGTEPTELLIHLPSDMVRKENSARIRFKAGYVAYQTASDSEAIVRKDITPDSLKAAMKLLIGHFYDNREEVTVGTINPRNPVASEFLMNPYRIAPGL